MRYLLHKTQLTELQARQQYLYDVFRMFFLPGNQERNFVPLRPVGSYNLDVLFITGHTNYVEDFLRRSFESISENIIVITSCMGLSFQKYTSKKDIYVPDIKQPQCYLRDGRPYGLGFNISDAELYFYNSPGTILEKIQSAYIRL